MARFLHKVEEVFTSIAFSEERLFRLSIPEMTHRMEDILSAVAYAEGGLPVPAGLEGLKKAEYCALGDEDCYLHRNS